MILLLSLILICHTTTNGTFAPALARLGNVDVPLPRDLSGRPCDAQPQRHSRRGGAFEAEIGPL